MSYTPYRVFGTLNSLPMSCFVLYQTISPLFVVIFGTLATAHSMVTLRVKTSPLHRTKPIHIRSHSYRPTPLIHVTAYHSIRQYCQTSHVESGPFLLWAKRLLSTAQSQYTSVLTRTGPHPSYMLRPITLSASTVKQVTWNSFIRSP